MRVASGPRLWPARNAGAAYIFQPLGTGTPELLLGEILECHDPTKPGGDLDYQIRVKNIGTGTATDFMVDLDLHSALNFVRDDSGGLCAPNGAGVSCLLATLGPGGEIRLGFETTVDTAFTGTAVRSTANVVSAQTDRIDQSVDTEVNFDGIFADGGEQCVF